MGDGTDEDGRVGGMRSGGEDRSGRLVCIPFLFLFLYSTFVRGNSYPETCAQRDAEGVGFHMLWCRGKGRAPVFSSVSFVFP